jgi:hypothetical protein
MSAIATQTPVRRVLDSLTSAGFQWVTGWYVPVPPDRALVRVGVSGSEWMIQRRRKPSSGWIQILRADVQDFDPSAFATWTAGWPLTA